MSIYKLSGERLIHLNNQMNRLRPGQIVQGKIGKIYPDSKAQIKLGPKTMIAQLEAPLTIGGKYHFQVKSTDSLIHLKVLGEQLKKENKINAKTLLQQLGFKGTHSNIALMKGLINQSIPFEKTDIANALPLLGDAKNKKLTAQLLQEMIVHKLPLQNSVLQALYSMQTSNISDEIRSMLSSAEKGSTETNLIRMLQDLNARPTSQNGLLAEEILKQIKSNSSQLFSLLKMTGAIDHKINFSTWKSEWNKFNHENQPHDSLKLPFGLKSSVLQDIEQINQNKTAVSNLAKEVFRLWGNKISEAVMQNTSLADNDFGKLKQQWTQLVSSLYGTGQHSVIKNLQNTPDDLENMLIMLTALSSSQTFTNSEHLLNQVKAGNDFLQAAPAEQFLIHLKQWLNASGVNYENQLIKNPAQLDTSLKGMLLQLLSSSNGNVQERAGQFIHFINGMQLHSVQESTGFLHAYLQIPGEKLGLLKNVELEFESRKTESGEINPEHCRVLFYLHLANLQETVIDMHIQKRAVSVTVYNDVEDPDNIFGDLKKVLKTGLEDLDYQLSIVNYRKLKKLETPVENTKSGQITSKGVDYRI